MTCARLPGLYGAEIIRARFEYESNFIAIFLYYSCMSGGPLWLYSNHILIQYHNMV
jgi:hypothetical protein